MPSRLYAPVLSVDTAKMHNVDPRNVESLFGMWTVFSKCANSIEEGKRYENLSWRLWNRETFCCPAQPQLAITPAIDIPRPRPGVKDVPELSASVDSCASDESDETKASDASSTLASSSRSSPLEDSALSRSRGNEKHLTPLDLKRMVVNIQEKKDLEPLSPTMEANLATMAETTPRPRSPSRDAEDATETDSRKDSGEENLHSSTDSCMTVETADTTRQSDHRGSDTSVSSDGLIRSGSVVHGFSPSQMSSSFRSRSKGHLLPRASACHALVNHAMPAKKNAMFTLGGSSGDDESSFEDRMSFRPTRSSLSESIGKVLSTHKKPSFREIVQAHKEERQKAAEDDEDVIESEDGSDDDVIDSAIEDEDDENWEDSNSDDGKLAPADQHLFQRVDSRPNLVSRRSMLTTALHEPERAAQLAIAASRSTPALHRSRRSSPTGPSLAASPGQEDEGEGEEEGGLVMRAPGSTRPVPITRSIPSSLNPAHSPRTTRRNMLSTELTPSLRQHLLWERQQKSTTANAVFKRRHTAQNMAGLQEYPAATTSRPASRDPSKNNSWNHYFETPWEYNAKGW